MTKLVAERSPAESLLWHVDVRVVTADDKVLEGAAVLTADSEKAAQALLTRFVLDDYPGATVEIQLFEDITDPVMDEENVVNLMIWEV